MKNILFFFAENTRFAWDVLTISRSLRRFFLQKKQQKIAVWLETSSQFRCRLRDQISENMINCRFLGEQNGRLAWDVLTISCSLRKKNIKRRKWTICLTRPHNFAACCTLKLMKKLIRKLIRFFKNQRLGWDVLTISRSRWRFLPKKCQKFTFRLRRPHNFADRHGRRIDRYVSKTDVWLETSSQFRFEVCPKMKNSLDFFFWRKTGVWLETSSQFRVLSGVFSMQKETNNQKAKIAVWLETSSQFRCRLRDQISWKNDKLPAFLWGGKTGVWLETSSQFRVLSGAFFFFFLKKKKKPKDESWRLPGTSSQFRGWFRTQINEKKHKKTDQIFQKRAFGLRRPHNFAACCALKLMKNLRRKRIRFFKNGRLGWDVLTISPSRGFLFSALKNCKTDVSLETSSQFGRPTRS